MASACGCSSRTSGPAPSTGGTAWSSWSAPTARPTRSAHPTSGWPGSGTDPLGFLRGLIDDVDHQLGDLLARRAALTAAAQPHKRAAERDPEREREIAARLAARAPALGEERLARILHAIITESLDAAGD